MFSMQSLRTAAPQHNTIIWMLSPTFWVLVSAVLAISVVITQFNGAFLYALQAAKGLELSALTVLLIAPVAEELFFRGVIQESLLRRGISAGKAIVLTALLFAVAHLYNSSLGHALATLLPALFIGVMYQQTRRYGLFAALASAIVLHSLFNAAWRAGIATYFSIYLPWFA
jgi:membrane protease YdiL (CAAX protease family)